MWTLPFVRITGHDFALLFRHAESTINLQVEPLLDPYQMDGKHDNISRQVMRFDVGNEDCQSIDDEMCGIPIIIKLR